MTLTPEAIFDHACQTMNNARKACERSRSKKTLAAYQDASEVYEIALAAFRDHEEAQRLEARKAIVQAYLAKKRTQASRQLSLFA